MIRSLDAVYCPRAARWKVSEELRCLMDSYHPLVRLRPEALHVGRLLFLLLTSQYLRLRMQHPEFVSPYAQTDGTRPRPAQIPESLVPRVIPPLFSLSFL